MNVDESKKVFDVFLAHNSADKPLVEALCAELRDRGLNPWIDIEQIPPGRWFQEIIQQAIHTVKSAAVIVGSYGLGKWQVLELRSFISRCIDEGIPVIPVLLPEVNKLPENLLFLKELNWVSFNERVDEIDILDNLEWGITGKHPQRRQTFCTAQIHGETEQTQPDNQQTTRNSQITAMLSQFRQTRNQVCSVSPKIKIDRNLLLEFDFEEMLFEFKRHLGFEGIFSFALEHRYHWVVKECVIPRLLQTMQQKTKRPYKIPPIEIRLYPEDADRGIACLEHRIIGEQNCLCLPDLLADDVYSDIVVIVWNFDIPLAQIRQIAATFLESATNQILPFLQDQSRCFVVIWVNMNIRVVA